jgi:Mrp family chromosome partitioning ATPase
MFARRRKPPVLAEISAPASDRARAGALRGADLEALVALLAKLGDCGAVLISGAAAAKAGAALGLASAAAAGGRRTALIECELAAPTLARELGLASLPGLHEYLLEQASAPQILQSAVLAGPASGAASEPLVCVVGGAPTAAGEELLASEGFRHAIAKLRSAYQLVVLDGPANSSGGESLQALAAEVEATLLCLAPAQHYRRAAVPVTGLIQRS